jgi:ribosomal protein S18 acetylase RimI-like enzyme
MQIRMLHDTPIAAITAAFNEGFSDYFLPVQLTEELMAFKIQVEDIDLRISVGAFDGEGQLKGLMLHGNRIVDGRRIAYNAGTAVHPDARRKGLVRAMYAAILPHLRDNGFHESLLEVIDINAPAIAAYEGIGFQRTRVLDVMVGYPPTAPLPAGFTTQVLSELPDLALLRAKWDYRPTWQHDFATVLNAWDRYCALGIFQGARLVGYAILVPFSGRVLQWAIHPDFRKRGLGKALLSAMQAHAETDLRFVNVEQLPDGPSEFLRAMGLRRTLGQYEMRLHLDPA